MPHTRHLALHSRLMLGNTSEKVKQSSQIFPVTVRKLCRPGTNIDKSTVTKPRVNEACVLSRLLYYGSEFWPTNRFQESRLSTFHSLNLGIIKGQTWEDRITKELLFATTKCREAWETLRNFNRRESSYTLSLWWVGVRHYHQWQTLGNTTTEQPWHLEPVVYLCNQLIAKMSCVSSIYHQSVDS